jgi:hypothetical protein
VVWPPGRGIVASRFTWNASRIASSPRSGHQWSHLLGAYPYPTARLEVCRGEPEVPKQSTPRPHTVLSAGMTPGGPSSDGRSSKDCQKKGRGAPSRRNRKSTAPNCCESSWCWRSRCLF